jgi:hypothetical protein
MPAGGRRFGHWEAGDPHLDGQLSLGVVGERGEMGDMREPEDSDPDPDRCVRLRPGAPRGGYSGMRPTRGLRSMVL